MVSSATKITPKDGRMKKNVSEVKMNISLQANSSRKYPVVEVSDKVKLLRKKTLTEKLKENKPLFEGRITSGED